MPLDFWESSEEERPKFVTYKALKKLGHVKLVEFYIFSASESLEMKVRPNRRDNSHNTTGNTPIKARDSVGSMLSPFKIRCFHEFVLLFLIF